MLLNLNVVESECCCVKMALCKNVVVLEWVCVGMALCRVTSCRVTIFTVTNRMTITFVAPNGNIWEV